MESPYVLVMLDLILLNAKALLHILYNRHYPPDVILADGTCIQAQDTFKAKKPQSIFASPHVSGPA